MSRENGTYYYNLLNKDQQKAYHAMKQGLLNLAPSFPVPRLEGRALADIFFLLRMDCPEIFYAVKFTYRFYPDASNVEFIPEYTLNKKQILEKRNALDARIRRLIRPAENMSEGDKELFIHDFICQNVTYDKLKKPYSHEIIGPLETGVGVCEGIAKTVKILCDRLGIWCILVLSENNPDKGIKYRHCWNMVKLGGKYYHLDCTFDNSLSRDDILRYDYVNLADSALFRDHEPSIWRVPECTDKDHFYYKEKKMSFTKPEDVANRSRQAVKKGKPLLFHWRGGYLTREVLVNLLELSEAEAIKKNKHAAISLNWPQAVLRIRFVDARPEENLKMEEANEGEETYKGEGKEACNGEETYKGEGKEACNGEETYKGEGKEACKGAE